MAKPTQKKATTGGAFAFADPQFAADDFKNFTTAEREADASLPTVKNPPPEPLPPLRQGPPDMALGDVVPAATLAGYKDYVTFHMVGDTGGIKDPNHQFLVADKMAEDFLPVYAPKPQDRPAFFFHLGDIVYYYGLEEYYFEQFYDPYRNYPAPIFAVPGNHDGVLPPKPTTTSLQAFMDLFCAATPSHPAVAQGASRSTMTQPGPYFTLNVAPFLKIIGLYSNTAEGTAAGIISDKKFVGQAQKDFLVAQLKAAKAFKGAVIIAVHHPPFTLSKDHSPSPDMLADIDDACRQAGFWPHAFFAGHAHLYERYTRYINRTQVPFVVAGCGGYPTLAGTKNHGSQPLRPPVEGKDRPGNRVVLENYFDQTFGFLRLRASTSSLSCEFVGVSDPATPGKTLDRFTVDLKTRQLTGFRVA